MNDFFVVGHRGFPSIAPENTISSFKKAPLRGWLRGVGPPGSRARHGPARGARPTRLGVAQEDDGLATLSATAHSAPKFVGALFFAFRSPPGSFGGSRVWPGRDRGMQAQWLRGRAVPGALALARVERRRSRPDLLGKSRSIQTVRLWPSSTRNEGSSP